MFETLEDLQTALHVCRRCADAGHFVVAPPICAGSPTGQLMIVGQAPGRVEQERTHRPFSGPAGKRLFRWLAEAGWAEEDFRSANYMTAITKCYPGPHPAGRGDRVPGKAEQALCQPWLEQELALVQPHCVVPVGGLAIGRFLGSGAKLHDVIGRAFARPADDDRLTPWAQQHLSPSSQVIPLPHPSGASQWFNDPGNQALLRQALQRIAQVSAGDWMSGRLPDSRQCQSPNHPINHEDTMQFQVKQGYVQDETADLLVVNLFEGVTEPGGALKAVDQALNGLVSQIITAGDFKGKLGQTQVLYSNGALPAQRVLLTGLGKQADFGAAQARKAASAAAKKARELGVARLATVVHGAGAGGLDVAAAAQAVAEGTLLGSYRYRGRKSERNGGDNGKPEIAEVVVLEADGARLGAVQQGVAAGQVVGEAANWARDLVNEPPNYLTPKELARRVVERAEAVGLKAQVFGEAAMAELGMGSFLGIARGSDEEAQFIVLEHIPQGVDPDRVPTVTLVGKAVTFDTGGISIKPAENMWKMKNDMGGGAATAAALVAAAGLNLPVHAVGLIAATENMPGGDAIKPSDVVTAMNGKTVEIISTDAEGRQVLADAMCYAARYKPDAMVDIATLTGAIAIALGPDLAGLFCDDETLRGRLAAAGEWTGEALWSMPLWKPYRKLLDTDAADMKHTGGRLGGAITAAIFLREFAGEQPWAHLDIASVAWQEENSAFAVRGASGFGARLLTELLRAYAIQ